MTELRFSVRKQYIWQTAVISMLYTFFAYYILANIALYRGFNDQYKENMHKIEAVARRDTRKSKSLEKAFGYMPCMYVF